MKCVVALLLLAASPVLVSAGSWFGSGSKESSFVVAISGTEHFEQTVDNSSLALVEFYAPWYGEHLASREQAVVLGAAIARGSIPS